MGEHSVEFHLWDSFGVAVWGEPVGRPVGLGREPQWTISRRDRSDGRSPRLRSGPKRSHTPLPVPPAGGFRRVVQPGSRIPAPRVAMFCGSQDLETGTSAFATQDPSHFVSGDYSSANLTSRSKHI